MTTRCRAVEYLEWTGDWVSRAARALAADGSLFLNVGAKPTDPWTALDVAQAARPHLQLQNTIHWIKSIAIEKALAGARADLDDDLAVGHYKPINSRRFLHDCHEFVFHFTPRRPDAARPPGDRRAVPGPVERRRAGRAAARACAAAATPGSSPTRPSRAARRTGPHPATFPPKLPEMCLRLHGLDRAARRRPVPRTRVHRRRLRATRRELHRHRAGRGLSRRKRVERNPRSALNRRRPHRRRPNRRKYRFHDRVSHVC